MIFAQFKQTEGLIFSREKNRVAMKIAFSQLFSFLNSSHNVPKRAPTPLFRHELSFGNDTNIFYSPHITIKRVSSIFYQSFLPPFYIRLASAPLLHKGHSAFTQMVRLVCLVFLRMSFAIDTPSYGSCLCINILLYTHFALGDGVS